MVPACWGQVLEAPASALDSKWCSSSDIVSPSYLFSKSFLSLLLCFGYRLRRQREEERERERENGLGQKLTIYILLPYSLWFFFFLIKAVLALLTKVLRIFILFYLLWLSKIESSVSSRQMILKENQSTFGGVDLLPIMTTAGMIVVVFYLLINIGRKYLDGYGYFKENNQRFFFVKIKVNKHLFFLLSYFIAAFSIQRYK